MFLMLSDGAPEEIRTPDPQILSRVVSPDTVGHSPLKTANKSPFRRDFCGFVQHCPRQSRTRQDTLLVLPRRYPDRSTRCRAHSRHAPWRRSSPVANVGKLPTGTCPAFTLCCSRPVLSLGPYATDMPAARENTRSAPIRPAI